MDDSIAAELAAMEAADRSLRAELASDGSLFDGYHPRMREVHERNADRLAQIIAQIGWPSPSTVGAGCSPFGVPNCSARDQPPGFHAILLAAA